MPKTTKKSKASRGNGLKKRFDLNNKKVQFFVVVGIVALLGGGWFTYKSFAATTTYFGADVIQCRPWVENGCQKISDTAKNKSLVVLLHGKDPNDRGAAISTTTVSVTKNNTYNYCVTAKGTGRIIHGLTYEDLGSGQSNAQGLSFDDTTKYVTKCRALTAVYTARGKIDFTAQDNAFVTISQVSLEHTGTAPSTGGGGK